MKQNPKLPPSITPYILLLTFLLPETALVSADMIELKNGQVLEAVVLSEDQTSYTARLNVGTITIDKESVTSIKEYAYEDNKTLLNKWSQPRKRNSLSVPLEKLSPSQQTLPPSQNEVRYVRFGERWITEGEYKAIKAEKEQNWESKLEKEKKRVKESLQGNQEEKLVEATKELIIQGTARRSSEANRVLHGYPWKHKKTDHFLIFYEKPETGTLFENKAEFFLSRIATDLDIRDVLAEFLERKIEIFVLESEALWEKTLAGKKLADGPSAFSKIYKREIFLNIENGYDVEFNLPHELAHVVLRAWADIQFSPTAEIPLWLNEGFANYQGNVVNLSASQQILTTAIKRNDHYPLAELLVLTNYPTRTDAKLLFYAEATSLVQYLFLNYGRTAFLEFLNAYVEDYNAVIQRKKSFDKNDAKSTFRKALQASSLKNHFSNFTVFEEAWLKSLQK